MVVLKTDFGRRQGEGRMTKMYLHLDFTVDTMAMCIISPFGQSLYVGSGWKDEDADLSGGEGDNF